MLSGNYKKLWGLIRASQPGKLLLGVALVFSLLETAASLGIPMLTRKLIDAAGGGSLPGGVLGTLLVLMAVATVAGGLAYFILGRVGIDVVANLRERLLGNVLHLPVPFFDENRSGEPASRLVNDTLYIKSLISEQAIPFISGLVMITGSVVVLCLLDWKLTAVLFGAVLLAFVVIIPIASNLQGISKNMQEQTAHFLARLTEVLAEMRLVKSHGAERLETEEGKKSIEQLRRYGLMEIRIQAMMAPLISMAIMGAMVAILGYGGARVSSGDLSVGDLVAFILYLFNIVLPLVQFTHVFSGLQMAAGAAERLHTLMEEPSEELLVGRQVDAVGKPIHLEQIEFGYEEDAPVLKGMNLTLEPGKTTAIVGPSGAGKSTLFALLARFYQPQSGSIRLGEVPLGEASLKSWRANLGYVAQDAPMLAGTVRENICYGLAREVSDDEVIEAARKAHAHEFIMQLPEGYATTVGERGTKLSGGQKQRVAIARALLRDPAVLMLDEATSALDGSTEHLVQDALSTLMAGRTTLVVAHRLATVVDAHRIVVLDDGKISGSGTHRELLASHEVYQELVSHQLTPIATVDRETSMPRPLSGRMAVA